MHEQAVKCNFEDTDNEIKQQIELSTNNSKLRKYSFQNPGKSLSELLTIAKTFESMKIQTEEIEKKSKSLTREEINRMSAKHSTYSTEKARSSQESNSCSKTRNTIHDKSFENEIP